MSKTHELKTWKEPFDAVCSGLKLFEYRRDDRAFQVRDTLKLLLWDPVYHSFMPPENPLSVSVQVIYVTRGPAFGIPNGYCVMSIAHAEDIRTSE